jgi:hypothetical protein
MDVMLAGKTACRNLRTMGSYLICCGARLVPTVSVVEDKFSQRKFVGARSCSDLI